MARKSDFEVGASIMALGVVLTIGSYLFAGARGGGMYLVCYGPIVYGLLRIGRGLGSKEARPSEVRPTSNDPRWGAARVDQVVGQACGQCRRKIIVLADGARCTRCSAPFHSGDCLQKHTAAEHGGAQ